MVSGHSGWSFWKASAMAERSASTQTVILAVGSCATVGKPYCCQLKSQRIQSDRWWAFQSQRRSRRFQ